MLYIRFIKRLLLILIVCLFALNIQAMRFRHLSMPDGLSQLSVLSIYQDRLGRMWFGTEEGVNIFDGNTVTAIKKFRGMNPHNLEVRRICGDDNGNVYFLLGRSVVAIDYLTQGSKVIVPDGVSALSCHAGHLYSYRIADRKIYSYRIADRKTQVIATTGRNRPNAIYVDRRGTVWIAAVNGLYTLSMKTRRLTARLSGPYVEYIFQDSHGNIWASSRDRGCYRIAPDGTTTQFSVDENTAKAENINAVLRSKDWRTQNHISSNSVREITEDSNGYIWIGTFLGLNRFDPKTGMFSVYIHTNNPQSISHQSVFPLISDREGTVWAGTYYGGVNYFTPDNDSFKFYAADINSPNCLSNPFVGHITIDKRGDIWVCTEGGGLNRIDHATHTVTYYMTGNNANSLPQNNLKDIVYEPSRDRLYIGTYMGGVSVLDIKSGKFTNLLSLYPEEAKRSGNRIVDMTRWHDRVLFTTLGGLWMLNPDTYKVEELIPQLKDYGERRIYTDRRGYLWAADGSGLYKISVQSRRVLRFYEAGKAGLGEVGFTDIREDSNGRIYVASVGGGIYRLDEKKHTFQVFDTDNSDIMSNFCYAFANVGKQLIYSTEHGIGVLNTTDDSFRNVEFSHDFPLIGINRGCGLFAVGNTILVGGTNGMVAMDVSRLLATRTHGRLYFSRLYINGKECLPGDGTDILDKAVYLTDEIHLNHDQNNITFGFATDNYTRSFNQPLFEYRLRSYDNTWYTTTGHSISYPKLPAGNYTLEVRMKPSTWQTEGDVEKLTLKLKVSPPFYLSTLAYIIYIAIFFSLICAFYYFKRSQLLLETSLAIEKKDRQNEEALSKAKLQFFTSISHEFRTPLTLIIAKLDYVMQNVQKSTAIARSLKSVNQNAGMMLELVNELLDFRKMEQGYTHLSVGKHDLVEFVKDITMAFDDMTRTKSITFTFSSTSPRIECWFDQRQMQKVVYNLVSNAFKYVSPQTGTIEVQLDQDDQHAILRVIDNGVGIASADIDRIFDRFYQANNAQTKAAATRGTGIGLALVKNIVERHHGTINVVSSEGYGSVFVVQLCKDSTQFAADEIETVEAPADEPKVIEESVATEGMAKVLVVEDNNELLATLRDIFSPLYHVVVAHNGKEGLDMTRAESPDIVVSDVMMPVMDGMEMCKAIKNDISVSHTLVLLLTAMSASEHEVEGLRCGADDYVAKPFNPSVLLARVAALLRMRSLLQQRFSKGNMRMADAQQFAVNKLDREFMQRCDEIVNEHIADSDFSVDDMARQLLIGHTSFFTKFKAITSMTPNEYLIKQRLSRAADYLRDNPTATIANVAYKYGFNSPRYFSQCFKKVYGANPTEWREKQ